MSTFQTVETRILIISDTHSTPLAPASSSQPFRHPLPSADVLIHCGDLTMEGLASEYHKTLNMLAAIDAPVKLIIAGNHDRTLDKTWMKNHERLLRGKQWEQAYDEAREMWFGKEGRAKKEGVTMLEEGVHEVEVGNGAILKLYASPYQPEFYDWAFPYEKHEDRYNPASQTLSDAKNIAVNPIPSFSKQELDIICTHGPPYKHGDITAHGNVGCPHLLKAIARARPLVHCFGHIHEGWGAETVTWSDASETEEEQTMETFKARGWNKHVKEVERAEVAEKEVEKQRAVFVDGKAIRRGEQTLLVNAAIMDVGYSPVNAPFVVDLDLPMKDDDGKGQRWKRSRHETDALL
ncbi:Metallo-dependent phosphatase [Aureobasidium sp. EXF-10728]|nr:Metallo-dependent phosphatase [Aureobasidium sp. EXF-10728]